MKQKDWIWMGHAGHFILGSMCRFRLNTYVGGYIVSTVGEYVPDSAVREIKVGVKMDKPLPKGDAGEYEYINRYGYDEIGAGRTYETMVFSAKKSQDKCCPYQAIVEKCVDSEGYSSAEDAYKGHLRLCKRWSKFGL